MIIIEFFKGDTRSVDYGLNGAFLEPQHQKQGSKRLRRMYFVSTCAPPYNPPNSLNPKP